VIDEEKQIRIEAEVPGMSPEDLDVTVTRDAIILKGEKKSEREQERQGVRYSERSFGSFERLIPVSEDIETDKIEARFRNGVLEIVAPKSEQALQRSKKIEIKVEEQQQSLQKQGRQDVQSSGAGEGMKQKSGS
jgi:HSP20 family protein